MPFLNSRGQSLHGRGGLRVSLDNKDLAPGGAVGWKTDDIAVYVTRLEPVPEGWEDPNGQAVVELDVRNGVVSNVAPRGANVGAANGGVWVCQLGNRLFASTGWDQRDIYFAAVGPSGEIAYTPHAGYPLRVHYADWRTDVPLGDPLPFPLAGLQLLGNGRAIGHIDEPQFRLVTIGMPTPVTVGRVRHLAYVEVNGEGWELCWAVDQGRILLHPATSTVGYVVRNIVTGGDAFNVAAIAQGANILIAWGTHEGEQAGESVSRLMDLSLPRVDLGAPVIDPPIDPEKPVEYTPQVPDVSAHLARVVELFPAEWDRANKIKHGGERTDEWIRKAGSYLYAKVDKRFGYNGKRGGDVLSADAIAYKNDTVPVEMGGCEVVDVIKGSVHELTWLNQTDVHGAGAKWIQPEPWVEPGDPIDPVDPNAGKHKYIRADTERNECDFLMPDGRQCNRKREDSIHQLPGKPTDPGTSPSPPLVQKLATDLQSLLAGMIASNLALTKRVEVLEAKAPGSSVSFPSKIALKTAHGKYVSAEEDGSITGTRDGIGGWEIFAIEKQE